MKVMCIDGVKIGELGVNKKYGWKKPADSDAVIFEGEIYTAIHDYDYCYMLAERPPFYSYSKNRFIPISSIEETIYEPKEQYA